MKVCLLNDSFPPVLDGVANVVINYARIMQEQGMADVLVGTPRYPDAQYDQYPYKVIPYQSFNTTKLVHGYRTGNPLDHKDLVLMEEFEPDIIHTHCPVASTIMARLIRAKCDAPIVFTYHTKFDEDIAKAIRTKFIQHDAMKFLASNIAACDEVWVVSEGAGANLRSLGYEGDYRVVSNGVDFAKGRVAADDVAKATAGYDLPEGVPMFLFVGRMMNYKGLPVIIDTMGRLSQAGMDFRMVFVGSGTDEDEIKEKARDLGLYDNTADPSKNKCIFVGAIHDRDVLRAWNTRADLFIFPSTYDTNGIVVREAAACGLASVLISGSCASEGITDGRNGYLTEKNPEAMSALLMEVCKDLDAVHQVGMNAMNEIYISWDDCVKAAHERYGEIIDLKARGVLKQKPRMQEDHFHAFSERLLGEYEEVADMPRLTAPGMNDNDYEHSSRSLSSIAKRNLKDL